MNEIWKSIKEYEGLYEVSNLGRVRSLDRRIVNDRRTVRLRGKLITPTVHRWGYEIVNLHKKGTKKMKRVHRLLAIEFLPNPENKTQVNHKDGDKTNNHISNLEWMTPKENTRHACETGLRDTKGEKQYWSKLKNEQIPVIRKLAKTKTHKEIADIYGVSSSCVDSVVARETWKHIV